MDPASPIFSSSYQRARVSGNLTDAGPSAWACSHPKLILIGCRLRDFGLETIAGKVGRKIAWFWSRMVKVVAISTQRNTNDGRGSEEWRGSVAWITRKF
jgi:hypothetical protein